MAQANVYNMNAARGAREDLSDQLKRVEPQETPLYSLLPQSAAPNALFTEWNVDDLAAPSITPVLDGTDLRFGSTAAPGVVEPGVQGDGDFADKFSNKARLGNRIQQLRKGFAVSPLAEKIEISGPQSSLYSEAKAKTAMELKRSIEVLIGSDEVGNTGTAGIDADHCAGLGAFVNPSNAAGTYWAGIGASGAAYRPVAASQLDLTTALGAAGTMVEGTPTGTNVSLRSMLQAVYTESGMKSTFRLFASPEVVNIISDFTRTAAGATRFNQSISGGASISLSVVEYQSDWGTLQIIPNIWMGRTIAAPGTAVANRAYLLPSDDTVSLKVLEGVSSVDLPDVGGGGSRGYVSWTGTLQVLNGKGIGSIV
jgi:hypothetical protein